MGLTFVLNAMMESETAVSFAKRNLLHYFQWSVDNKGEETLRLVKRYLHTYTVIPRLTKIIRSGITFVSRNFLSRKVISRRFL